MPAAVTPKVDWTALWAKKYPGLASYQQKVMVEVYAQQLRDMLADLRRDYGYRQADAY